MPRVVHLPVLVPGWIKIDPHHDPPHALHVEVAPDEAVLDETRSAFWDSDGDGDGPPVDPDVARSLVGQLANASFVEIGQADLYS